MIYVTGDTHRKAYFHLEIFCREHPELTKEDFIIVAGDFGGVWDRNTLDEDLAPYSALPVTVLFVDGNHENFDLLESYPVEEWHGGKVHIIRPDIIHLMRGQVFELEGKRIFTFGGATSTDIYRREEGVSWWPRETPTFDEMDVGIENLRRYDNKVDYIITHSCCETALMYPPFRTAVSRMTIYSENQLLEQFNRTVEYRHWYFGHYHVDTKVNAKMTALLFDVVALE